MLEFSDLWAEADPSGAHDSGGGGDGFLADSRFEETYLQEISLGINADGGVSQARGPCKDRFSNPAANAAMRCAILARLDPVQRGFRAAREPSRGAILPDGGVEGEPNRGAFSEAIPRFWR